MNELYLPDTFIGIVYTLSVAPDTFIELVLNAGSTSGYGFFY